MFTDNTFSTSPALAEYINIHQLPNTDAVSYYIGPVAFQDTSMGLAYQTWRTRLINYDVSIVSPNTPEYIFYSEKGITAIDLAFDQNARPLLLYIIDGNMKLYWFDPLIQGYTHTLLDTEVSSARMTLDDTRPSQIPFSEIVLGYVKSNILYVRNQSDRYTVPYTLQTGVVGKIMKIGMSRGLRLQFLFEQNPFPVYEDPWPYGAI